MAERISQVRSQALIEAGQQHSAEIKAIEKAAAMIGFAFSARAILFVSVIGAIALAAMVMIWPSWVRVAGLLVYSLIAIMPLVGLEIRRREP